MVLYRIDDWLIVFGMPRKGRARAVAMPVFGASTATAITVNRYTGGIGATVCLVSHHGSMKLRFQSDKAPFISIAPHR